jgi:hypothetical protein
MTAVKKAHQNKGKHRRTTRRTKGVRKPTKRIQFVRATDTGPGSPGDKNG